MLPKKRIDSSPNQLFFGEIQDVSKCVPFYSSGWYHLTAEERNTLTLNELKDDRARNCIMLGYTNPYILPDKTKARVFVKNAYICYIPKDNVELVRHDCLFKNYPDHNDPLNSEVTKDNPYETDLEIYDDMYKTDSSKDDSKVHSNQPTSSDTKTDEFIVNKKIVEFKMKLRDKSKSKKNKKKTESVYLSFTEPLTEPIVSIDVGTDLSDMQPNNLTEALSSVHKDYWSYAFRTEMNRLGIRDTWTITPFDPSKPEFKNVKPIKSKFAFRLSVKPNGNLKFRSRLVACGYSQRFGIDYDSTYCPTCKYKSLLIILHLAAIHGWKIQGIDVENAFIEPEIDKPIYMYLPKELYYNEKTKEYCHKDKLNNSGPIVVKLNKSIYGLKQAGDLWYKLLNEEFINLGYKRSIHDNCIYTRFDGENKTYVVVYVDDVLFIGNDFNVIDSTINILIEHITKLNEIDVIERYIGIDIKRDEETNSIYMSQLPYTQQYINRFVDSTTSKDVETPMSPSIDYSQTTEEKFPSIQPEIGKLRYLADRTRPDIATAVGILGSNAANPSSIQIKGLKFLGDYLKTGYPSTPIKLGGMDPYVILFGYVDASNNPRDKSRLGYCFYVSKDSGVILARSFRSKLVSHSSCESEIMAIDEAVRQIIWLRGFLSEMGFTQLEPTVLYTDSQSAQTLIESYNIGNNSAHLVMRLNFLHECVLNKIVSFKYINTDDEVADILTKILNAPKTKKFSKLMLKGHGNLSPETLVINKLKKFKVKSKKKKKV
jgi:hypothetical protein